MLASKIFDTYVAAGFFATVIFFVLNASIYTPIEMTTAVVLVTTAFKGISHIMFSMTISLINLDNQHDAIDFEKSSNKLESLVNDLAIQKAAVLSGRANNS
jgi:hypothetical protein